ncbi:hypothetical protein D3C85_1457240 [compost metagenome]
MVDDAAVDLFGHALVEAAIASFHVEGRDLAALGRQDRHAAVGIAQHQERIGLDLGQGLVGGDNHLADGFGAGGAGGAQEMVRFADAQVLEEDFVEFVVVVLSGMNQDVIAMAVQAREHARQPNDFRPGADDGGDFKFFHVREGGRKCRDGRGRRFRWPRA